jgi:hypothetical protein
MQAAFVHRDSNALHSFPAAPATLAVVWTRAAIAPIFRLKFRRRVLFALARQRRGLP